MTEDPSVGTTEVPAMTDDDKAKQTQNRFTAAKKFRSLFDHRWVKDRELARGKLSNIKLPNYQCDVNINDLQWVIQRSLAITTDGKPAIEIGAREPGDDPMAETMKLLTQNVLDKNVFNAPEQSVTVETDRLTLGTGIWKCIWDEKFGPQGEVRLDAVNPIMVYPAPGAVDFDESCRYVIHVLPMTREEIERRWPDKKEIFKQLETMTVPHTTPEEKVLYDSYPYTVSHADGSTSDLSNETWNLREGKPLEGDDIFRVLEDWYLDKDGKGRVRYVLGPNMIEDKENPYNAYGWDALNNPRHQYPFVKIVDTLVAHEFWGMGEPEQLESIIRAKTNVIRKIVDWINLTVSPQMTVDKASGIDINLITNSPMMVYPVRPGTADRAIVWRQVPPIPPSAFSVVELLDASIQIISGVADVTQGRSGRVVAGKAIAALQEAAQTLLRLKIRYGEAATTRLGQLVVARIQQFYTERRVIRTTMENGGSGTLVLNAPVGESTADQVAGMQEHDPTAVLDPTTGRFDLRIGAGSMQPVSKVAMADLAIQISGQIGPDGEPIYMTPRDLLKQLGFPNADKLQDNVDQRRGIVEQMQQQMQQSQEQIEQLKQELDGQTSETTKAIQTAEAEINRLKNSNESMQAKLERNEVLHRYELALERDKQKTIGSEKSAE